MQSTELLEERLPLTVTKKSYLKVAGILVLIVAVILVNVFFLQKNDDKAPTKKAETYSLQAMNPVTHPEKEVVIDETTNSQQAELQKQLAEAKAKDFVERLQASQTVDAGSGASTMASNHQVAAGESAHHPANMASYHQNENSAFLEHASQATPDRSYAQTFTPRPYLIGQGKFIFGTLAVAIHSDLPGQITATVTHDVYGEQGRNVLIPRGSRLIGEYRSGLSFNQTRVFVVWTRVLTPNGLSVMLGSSGTDALGQSGLTGDVQNHFFARFGAASLISLIGAGASTVGVNPQDENNSMAVYRQAIAQSTAQQASNILSQTVNTPPTIRIAQGEKIVVFVNKDLDFSRVRR